jgi:ribosomal protein S27E
MGRRKIYRKVDEKGNIKPDLTPEGKRLKQSPKGKDEQIYAEYLLGGKSVTRFIRCPKCGRSGNVTVSGNTEAIVCDGCGWTVRMF